MPVLPSHRNQSIDLYSKSIDWFYMRATLAFNVLAFNPVGVNGILYTNEDCWSVFQVVRMDEDCMTAFLRIFEETIE